MAVQITGQILGQRLFGYRRNLPLALIRKYLMSCSTTTPELWCSIDYCKQSEFKQKHSWHFIKTTERIPECGVTLEDPKFMRTSFTEDVVIKKKMLAAASHSWKVTFVNFFCSFQSLYLCPIKVKIIKSIHILKFVCHPKTTITASSTLTK